MLVESFVETVEGLQAALKSAISSDDRVLAAQIQAQIDNAGVSFSTRDGNVAGLEAALAHAISNDDRVLAANIKAKLGR